MECESQSLYTKLSANMLCLCLSCQHAVPAQKLCTRSCHCTAEPVLHGYILTRVCGPRVEPPTHSVAKVEGWQSMGPQTVLTSGGVLGVAVLRCPDRAHRGPVACGFAGIRLLCRWENSARMLAQYEITGPKGGGCVAAKGVHASDLSVPLEPVPGLVQDQLMRL
eukprot:1161821-Pelagomonas_calceolata.AAC.17